MDVSLSGDVIEDEIGSLKKLPTASLRRFKWKCQR